MENFFEKLSIDNKPPPRQQPDPQNKNQNFRRPPPQQNLQILQRENRNQDADQGNLNIKPPFPQNFLDDDNIEEDTKHNHIHLVDKFKLDPYLTRSDYENDVNDQRNQILTLENDDYRKGYHNALIDF